MRCQLSFIAQVMDKKKHRARRLVESCARKGKSKKKPQKIFSTLELALSYLLCIAPHDTNASREEIQQTSVRKQA